jgi:hypothetical protein
MVQEKAYGTYGGMQRHVTPVSMDFETEISFAASDGRIISLEI